jgi:hypothetical protein
VGILFAFFALSSIANGVWMLFAPESWYYHLPAGVPDTGPFNHHFVQDIGAATPPLAGLCAGCRAAICPGAVVARCSSLCTPRTWRFSRVGWTAVTGCRPAGRLRAGDHLLVLCLPRWET